MHILHCCVLVSCKSVCVNLEMFGRYDSLYIMSILLIYPSVGVVRISRDALETRVGREEVKSILLTAHTHSCYSAHVFVSKLPHQWEGLNNCCSPTQMTSHLRGRYCEKGLDAHTHTN